MPRVALSLEQKKAYKLNDFKVWVYKQMKLSGMNQTELGEALGVSQAMVSKMLRIPNPKSNAKINPDPFSYGDMLILFDLFEADEKERVRLSTL